jgi:hypothetical protein
MDCMMYYPKLKPIDKLIAFVIAQHVNEKTGLAFVSDEVIAERIGGASRRSVYRARGRLRDAGWLTWRCTRTANVYTLKFDSVNAVLDMITTSRDARSERRKNGARDGTRESQQGLRDGTRESQHDGTRESHIHLRGTH